MMLTQAFPLGWRIVPASVHGSNHIEEARENQDCLGFRRLGTGYVVAVADGAGSRSRSATGSRLAVDAACDAAEQVFEEQVFAGPGEPATLAEFRKAGRRFAGLCLSLFDDRLAALLRVGPPTAVSDYATTLLAVVARPPYFAFLSVGDGFLIVQHGSAGARLLVAAEPDPDDHGTVFLTTDNRERELRCGVLADADLTGLALCTDGLTEGLLAVRHEPGRPRRYLAPDSLAAYFQIFADPHTRAGELARQLDSAEFAATSGDDKTMIVAVRL